MDVQKEVKLCRSLAARNRELAAQGGIRLAASSGHPEGFFPAKECMRRAEAMECNAEGLERFGAEFDKKEKSFALFQQVQQKRRADGVPFGQRRK